MLIGGSNSAKAADVEWDVTSSDTYSFSGTNNVTLKNRTFTANTWEGLCLPFSVSAETMASVFGEDYNLQEFDSYENNTIKFKKATAVAAGKPYYIKISNAVSDPVFNNVTFGSSLSGWQNVSLDDNIYFRGFYYKIYDYQLVESQNRPVSAYWLENNSLKEYNNGLSYNDNGRVGTQSYFYVKDYTGLSVPTISFEGSSSDSGNTGGGNTDGGNTDGGNTDGDNTGNGIQMGVKTEITGEWGGNIAHQIPASAFLSDAQCAILQFVGTNYCLITNTNTDTTVREFQWNDANQMGVTLVLTGDLLQAAKNGYLSIKVNGGSSYKFYVTNFPTETPVREQLTDLPTIYLTVPAAINKDINSVLKKENGEAPYYQATIQVVDNSKSLQEFTDSKLEIKVRGNSTADGMKRPYRLKFAKDEKDPVTGEVITSHKHDLLGAGYSKRNWVLMANAFDGSMVRNALSYRVGQLVGMDFCPGWKFVDLVINEEYRGTYMVSDHLEVGNHRIDVDEDTGWYIEANGQERMAEEPYTSGGGLTLSIKNPEPTTEAETAALKSAVSTFFTDLSAKFNASNSADPTTGWRSMADEESLLAFWLGVNISANYDGFMTVKMFRDVDDPRIHFGPLWDHDLAWGNYTDNLGHRIEEGDNGNFNQIVRKAWEDPLFVKKLHAKWHQLVNAGLKQDLLDYVDMLHSTIEQSEVLNHQKWTTYQAGFEDSGLKTHDETIAFLKNFIDKHVDGIQDQIDAQYEALKNQMPEDGPEDEPDDTPVGDLGALKDLGNGRYSYTGSASTFKEGTEITITTSTEETTLSNYITEGNTWNTIKSITLTADDVTTLAANGYTFYMNATNGEVKAVNVKVPVAPEVTGLEDTGEQRNNGNLYIYRAPKSAVKVGATLTITISDGSAMFYTSDKNTQFDGLYYGKTYTKVLDQSLVDKIIANNYSIDIVVSGGTCTSAEITYASSGGSPDTPSTQTHTLTLSASEGGTVTGAGEYAEGTTVLIKAIPNEGYKFVKWSDDNTYASRSVTLNEAITLTATFALEGSADTDPFNEQGTRKQLTANIPTIYIDTNAAVGDSWGTATLDIYDSANLLYSTSWKSKSVSIQYQGSGAGGKDSYRLKFEKKTQMMDSGSFKQWVLLANDDDPTMLNNALAKVIGDAVGMPYTPGYQFVDLYVNNTYMGTYQLTDRVKAELGRSLVADGDNTYDWHVRFNDNGELAEDNPATTDYITGTTTMPNIIIKNPDPDDYHAANDEAGLATLKSTMSDYFTTVFATDESGNYTNIADMVNTDQLVAWYIAQEILGVYKGFSSIEAYRSVTSLTDQKLHFGPLWDSEKGFGNTGEVTAPDNTTDLDNDTHNALMISWSAYPMMKNLFTNLWTQPWFKTAVKTKWEEISETLPDALSQTITTLSGTIAESQALNAQKWSGSLGSYASYEDALAATNTYITNRFAYLDKKFAVLAEGACEHTYTNSLYADNGDGTHSPKCDKCDYVNTEVKTAHSYTAKENHPYCDICKASEAASIEGTVANDTKVYRIHESEKATNIKYVAAESNFSPGNNKIYVCDEEITEETNNLTNVVWPRSGDTDYNGNEIVLSDGDYTYDEKASMHVKSASYTRSMSSTWGTLCLPFKVASCDDYTLYEIKETKINDDNESGTIVFSEISAASGLQPVVFRKKTSAGSVTFHGVAQTKEGADNGLVTVKKSKKLGNTDALLSTGVEGSGTWALYGNVKKSTNTKEISPNYSNVYYIASNKFWQGDADVTVGTFRAVFVFTPAPGNEAAAKSFSISFGGNTTDIRENSIEKNLAIFVGNGEVILDSNYDTRVSIYKVGGMLVTNTNIQNGMQKHITLPSGLYIINGTKVAVK